jgi:hypothetical protein
MARLEQTFDPSTVEPRDDFSPIPAGTYVVEVIESEEKAANSGRMIKFTLKVVEGEYENRRLWDHVNYINESAVAQRIGQQQLGALQNAVGLTGEMDDTEVLHGVPVLAKITIEPDKSGKYGDKNRIKDYAPYSRDSKFEVKKSERAPANDREPEKKTATGGKPLPWKK